MKNGPKSEPQWSMLRRVWVISSYQFVQAYRNIMNRIVLRYTRQTLTIVYFTCLILLSLYIWRFGGTSSLTSTNSSIFITTGAMVAGMLAITFSLRILLIQTASQSLSSGLFDIIAREKGHNSLYWILSLMALLNMSIGTILAFNESILASIRSSFGSAVIVVTSGSSFYFIFLDLTRTYDRVNPKKSLEKIKVQIVSLLHGIDTTARQYEKYVCAKHPELVHASPEERLAMAFASMKQYFSSVLFFIVFLFDYHDKLRLQQENATARRVLKAISDVAVEYMRIRASSSRLVQSWEPLVPLSDSHAFFRDILEPLVARAKQYIKSEDDVGVTEVIRSLESLVVSATEISHIGDVHGENPVVDQCIGYFEVIIVRSGSNRYEEGLFQCANSLCRIALKCGEAGIYLLAPTIASNLRQIVLFGIAIASKVVWEKGLTGICNVIHAQRARSGTNGNVELQLVLNHLRESLVLVFRTSPRLVNTVLNCPFKEVAWVIGQRISSVTVDSEHSSIELVADTCKQYSKFLRELSSDVKSADSFLIGAAAKSIVSICCILISKQKKSVPGFDGDEIRSEICGMIYLLSRFAIDAEKMKSEYFFDEIVESAAIIGIFGAELSDEQIAIDSIKVIEKLGREFVEKSHESYYGVTFPKIIKRACFIGILSLKKSQRGVIPLLKEVVKNAEASADKQILEEMVSSGRDSLPEAHLIVNEVGHLYEDCSRERYLSMRLSERSEHLLFTKIECEDIDHFCEEIWGFKASEKYKTRYIY